jgi:hypothetical protein
LLVPIGRVALLLAGLAGLAVLILARPRTSADPAQPRQLTGRLTSARALLGSSELHGVATDNLMKAGHAFFGDAERDIMQAVVSQVFANLTADLSKQSPAASRVLGNMWLGPAQRGAVLEAMQLLSDSRVQSIGLDVARAVRQGAPGGRPSLQQSVDRSLRERRAEIGQLREELLPKELANSGEGGSAWDLLFDQESVRIMATVNGEWDLGPGSRASALAADLPRADPAQPALLHPGKLYSTRRLLFGDSGGVYSRNVFRRHESELTEVREMQAAVSLAVREQGRAFLAILGGMRAIGTATVGPASPRVLLTGNMAGAFANEDSRGVSCAGPAGSAQNELASARMKSELLCLLKFGTHGLGALRQARHQ